MHEHTGSFKQNLTQNISQIAHQFPKPLKKFQNPKT